MLSRRRFARSSARLTPTFVIIATLVAVIGLCGLMTWTMIDSYREAWHQAAIVTDNVATLLERDIARNFELFDLSMQTVLENLADPEVTAASPSLRQRSLFDHTMRARDYGGIRVIDATGKLIAESSAFPPQAADFADREYFQHQLHAPTGSNDLYIGEPIQSRLAERAWTVPLTRRINNPDGSFAGIVLGVWRISYIESLFRQVSVGRDGILYLMRNDGVLIARMPHQDMLVGQSLQTSNLIEVAKGRAFGRFAAKSPIDGIYRLSSFRRVADRPFIISAGMSVDEFLAGWWRKTLIIVGALGVVVFGVLALAVRFSLELKRRSRAEHALADMATTDDLTGLANRRKFEATFDLEWRRAERDASLFSLLMIDVDVFKKYNDTYGHQEGDRILRRVAAALAGGLARPGDLVARYGGEEFAVLLPQTDDDGARLIAESIRRGVAALACEHVGSVFGIVTISIGVATVKPRYLDHPSVLIRAADQALYRAKSMGRNAVAQTVEEELAKSAERRPSVPPQLATRT